MQSLINASEQTRFIHFHPHMENCLCYNMDWLADWLADWLSCVEDGMEMRASSLCFESFHNNFVSYEEINKCIIHFYQQIGPLNV